MEMERMRLKLKRQGDKDKEEKAIKKRKLKVGSWSVMGSRLEISEEKNEGRDSSYRKVSSRMIIKGVGKRKATKRKYRRKRRWWLTCSSHKEETIVLSWNYQGAGLALIVQALKKLKKKYEPDVVFLMETKNKSSRLESVRKKLKMEEGVYCESEGLSWGLALWWKKKLGIKVIIGNKNFIEIVLWDNGKRVYSMVFWIYGARIFEERKKVWKEIKRKIGRNKEQIMCLGNFNDILNDDEKEGGRKEGS
ncbi:hypothetical protein DITRI_Ditri06bG0109700 [Diplodiscus trichospermus]